jgi:DNA-binding Lrp family transcriptional regulator
VSVATLKATVSDLPKRFTLARLADRAGGGSPATVKKAVDELVEAGVVVRIGPDPDHSGPGRAPTLYEQR